MDFKKSIKYFNFAFFFRSILLLQPVMLLFYQMNGLTVKDFFFFQGIFYLSSILFELPVGYISDIISKKKLIMISYAILLGILLMWFFFRGYYVILAGEICFALSKVIMDNNMSGYLCDFLNYNNQPKAMTKYYGRLNFSLSIGTTIAALVGTWMYKVYNVNFILICESLIILFAIILISKLPDFKQCSIKNMKERMKEFCDVIKTICSKPNMKYYILYSGFLTAFSILFATAFQPLMQNSLCPIALFGIIAFANHGIRALSGIIAGKVRFNIQALIKPLFLLYLLGFGFIFIILNCKNIMVVAVLLLLTCLIIGLQLIFTIMHVSRLHKLVSTFSRGCLMAVNNIITRTITAVFLISSQIFINKTGLSLFFMVMLGIFLIFCSYIVIKMSNIKEEL